MGFANCEIENVELRNQVDDLVGHTWILLPDGTGVGHYPGLDVVKDGNPFTAVTKPGATSRNDGNHPETAGASISFSVCPATRSKLEESISAHFGDPYQAANKDARNCTGWACERWNDAGLQGASNPRLPGLRPGDVSPIGDLPFSGKFF